MCSQRGVGEICWPPTRKHIRHLYLSRGSGDNISHRLQYIIVIFQHFNRLYIIFHILIMHQTRSWKCRFTSTEKACGHFSIIILLGSKGWWWRMNKKITLSVKERALTQAALTSIELQWMGGALAACLPTENTEGEHQAVLRWSAIVLSQQMTMQPVKYNI